MLRRSMEKKMDLKLTEEERLIRNTAAQFVDKELISREGDYLRQDTRFLSPGAPVRRRLQPAVSAELAERARQAGLSSLEIPEKLGGSPLSVVARVLVHREFGRAILPFRPVSIPAFLFDTPHGEKRATGELSLALAFEEAHKTCELSATQILYRQEPDGTTLRDSSIFVSNSGADLFLFPAREQGSDRLGPFFIGRDAPGVTIADHLNVTT